jgi:two-component system, OmpR family, copper resistance phosphate regulon response regulator CusR
MRLLLVEDDPELGDVLKKGFGEQRIETVVAPDFARGNERARLGTHDVIILDVMLPGGSGFDLCGLIRSRGVTTPILMLTARDSVDDRVRGFERGADDYLPKPFAFRELLARVRALARRRPALAPTVHQVADLEIDLAAPSVRRAGHQLHLTAKELALLECLVRHPGQVVDRPTITAYVWDENHDPFTNVLEVLVRRLRRKVDDGHDRKLIHTLRGVGYRLGAEG